MDTPHVIVRFLLDLAILGSLGIGLWTVAGWLANQVFRIGFVRVFAMRHGQRLPVEVDEDYGDWYDVERGVLTEQTADVCADALRRALDAMRNDPRLAKREIEYVLEEIAA